jgi:hypothetical protein
MSRHPRSHIFEALKAVRIRFYQTELRDVQLARAQTMHGLGT